MHEIVSPLSWLHIALAAVNTLYLIVPIILIWLVFFRILSFWRHRGILPRFRAGMDFPWDEANGHRQTWHHPDGAMSQLFAQSQEQVELFNLPDSHMDGL